MKRLSNARFVVLVLVTATACNTENSELESHAVFARLANHWTTDANDPEATQEVWKKTEDGWKGQGFNLNATGDTTFVEHLSLRPSNDTLTYFARVPSQNEGGEIGFALTTITDSSLKFENPTHSFPQWITYTIQKEGGLKADVGAMENGKEVGFTLHFSPLPSGQ